MNNHRQLVIDAIKKAGYEFVRVSKHGDLYKKDGKIAIVPKRIITHKLAMYEIRKLEK